MTSLSTIDEHARSTAHIVARAPGTVAGLGVALRVFELLDDDVAIGALASDGDRVDGGTRLATIEGSSRTILAGERLALNLLGQLSGVASATRALVDAVDLRVATLRLHGANGSLQVL